jgi:hypothetical protein
MSSLKEDTALAGFCVPFMTGRSSNRVIREFLPLILGFIVNQPVIREKLPDY